MNPTPHCIARNKYFKNEKNTSLTNMKQYADVIIYECERTPRETSKRCDSVIKWAFKILYHLGDGA